MGHKSPDATFEEIATQLSPIAVSRFLAATSSWRLGKRDAQVSESWEFLGNAVQATVHVVLPTATGHIEFRVRFISALRSIAAANHWTARELVEKIALSGVALVYERNPKHAEPWQRGRRGTLCPKDADGPGLLALSDIDPRHPGKRYATDGNRAYCGQEHLPGRWHGYPVQWKEVPRTILRQWLADKRVNKRSLRENW
jgi:hypothetical protein